MNKFFQDNNGNFSTMRLVFVSLIAYAMAFGAVVLHKEGSIMAIAFITAIVGIASTFKIVQNQQEKK